MPCHCTSGLTSDECCEPFITGAATPPTAVRLMRSRYTAFVVGDAPYLLATWHPETRPALLELDPDQVFYALAVLSQESGGFLDSHGTVEFVARWRTAHERGALHEVSRFQRVEREWRYVDGIVHERS